MLMKTLLLSILLTISAASIACDDHAAHKAASTVAAPSGNSLYQIDTPLIDQAGNSFKLADEQARITIISMFYGDCNLSCPIVMENVKRTIEAVPLAQRKNIRALLISLNPGIDTPQSLAGLAKVHQFDPAAYRLAVSDNDGHTRQIAASLGIKYRRAANGEINHNTRFILMNQQGIIIKTSDTLSITPDPEILAAILSNL
ncbi:SCO family protein [Iodobacter sp. LRB]|uniref:SCO family protein n=1 Tax=unclassified Iodobacter TaxID=235634 RepID=UPI000C101174|nr:SCO family protein [Iodobacter sp. BJB302]PHV00279.1 SCO family protein [Iodobacter sp. BJB302]